MAIESLPASYAGLRTYVGDIHNHCGISYGHGSLEDAYTNARLQLDFASVTGHAHWHDMPRDEERLAPVVAYHERGFSRLASVWDQVVDVSERFNEAGRFVTFPSFEWHSMRHGDHCVYFNGPEAPIIRAPDLESLRVELRRLRGRGTRSFMIPHHICYRSGWRGINWDDFTPELSPVVEMMSMHGCGEYDDGPRPYLHSMGPRDSGSSMREGLRRGLLFGVIGSTDHHSAHPGSHGHGRLACWAPSLTRESIWQAIAERRVFALTGDRIDLAVELNGAPMGSAVGAAAERELSIAVVAGGALDYVEVVRDGEAVYRLSAHEAPRTAAPGFQGRVGLAVGWGRRLDVTHWDVELGIVGGRVVALEPRFRGADVVAPQASEQDSYQFTRWERLGEARVRFSTRTHGNPTTTTNMTQAFMMEIEGDDDTRVVARINGEDHGYSVGELRQGGRSGYTGGYLSGAYRFERAVPRREFAWTARFVDRAAAGSVSSYYVRVRQKNDEWAWSSPIWVGRQS
ncbi:MAG: PHP domain-containing protein [Chloroflexota bacterium]